MLEFVRCPKCGNERDFHVTLRFRRRPHDSDLDDSEGYSGRERHYRPDRVTDQQVIVCGQCNNSVTYAEARQTYTSDAHEMSETVIIPSATPLPPVNIGDNYHDPKIFVSGAAYHICTPTGISDRTVESGVVADLGYVGRPDRGVATLGILYHMDRVDMGARTNASDKGKMSFQTYKKDIPVDDIFAPPPIPSEMIEAMSHDIYERVNLYNDSGEGNELDHLFGSKTLSNEGGHSSLFSDIYVKNIVALDEEDIAKWREKIKYGAIYRKYLSALREFSRMMPKGWNASLKITADGQPFLSYRGRSALRALAKINDIQGVPIYYTGSWRRSRENWQPQSVYDGSGY